MFSTDPYLAKTFDRQQYNCWNMVNEAWLELTGEALELSITGRHGPYLERVDHPVSPCVVVMIWPGAAPHAGLYRNGRVLHIRQAGARFERLADATRGFAEVRYYAKRHADQRSAGTG